MSVIDLKVKLDHPFTLHGVEVGEIELRRATVADVRRVSKLSLTPVEQEFALAAALVGCETDDLERMDFADFSKVQAVLKSLLGGDKS